MRAIEPRNRVRGERLADHVEVGNEGRSVEASQLLPVQENHVVGHQRGTIVEQHLHVRIEYQRARRGHDRQVDLASLQRLHRLRRVVTGHHAVDEVHAIEPTDARHAMKLVDASRWSGRAERRCTGSAWHAAIRGLREHGWPALEHRDVDRRRAPSRAYAKDDVRAKGTASSPHLQNAGALKSFPSMPVT